MAGLLNGVGIGEAKKLTLMARRNRDAVRGPKLSACSVFFKTKKMMSFRHLLQCSVWSYQLHRQDQATSFPGGSCSVLGTRVLSELCAWSGGYERTDPELQIIADYYIKLFQLSRRSSVEPQSPFPWTYPLDTMSRNRGSGGHKGTPKTNSSVDMPTNSTADESLDTDPFSRELDGADFCFSSDEEETNSSVLAEPDQSPPTSDSESTTLVPWKSQELVADDDFVPRSAAFERVKSRTRLEEMLFQLNATAEGTYVQTQNTSLLLQSGELD